MRKYEYNFYIEINSSQTLRYSGGEINTPIIFLKNVKFIFLFVATIIHLWQQIKNYPMKRIITSLAIISSLLLGTSSFAQVKWSADPAHTSTVFSVKHLGISFVEGKFTSVTGTLETKTDKDFNNATVAYNVDVNSINTSVEARDNHLKSPDFFDAAKFPSMELKSVSFTKVKGNTYKLVADLTIHGITKRTVFTAVENGGIITDPWGKTRVGFTATTTVNRHDFGLKYNDKLPSGVEAVASMVQLTINTELVKN